MRLYLSSFRIGHAAKHLVTLGRQGGRVAIICNACDLVSHQERESKVNQENNALRALGFSPFEIDLRLFFKNTHQSVLEDHLLSADYVWVRGGNTFVLRRAMAASGFDKMIVRLLKDDRLVYAGYSAGIAVLGTTLRGLDLVDEANAVPKDYSNRRPIWKGLSVFPFSLVSHFRSDHPEASRVDDCVNFLIEQHLPFIALRDNEVLIFENHRLRTLRELSQSSE